MRNRGFAIALVVLVALVVVVMRFGGRIEQALLRLHGVHPH